MLHICVILSGILLNPLRPKYAHEQAARFFVSALQMLIRYTALRTGKMKYILGTYILLRAYVLRV